MSGRVAIVTGGAGGLGREIVFALFRSGCRVCVNYYRSREEACTIVDGMAEKGIALQADVGDYEAAARMGQQVNDLWGRVDIVVNNAGITRDALLIKQSEEDWDNVMAVNVKGAFNVMKACMSFMKSGGHIVNISSYSGIKGKTGQAAYSASKAALLGLTKTAAIELAGRGI